MRTSDAGLNKVGGGQLIPGWSESVADKECRKQPRKIFRI